MRAGRLEARCLCARREALARRAILGPTPLQRVQGATLYHSPLHHLPLTTYYLLTYSLTHSPPHLLRVEGTPRRARAAVRQGGRARAAARRPFLPAAQPRHRG